MKKRHVAYLNEQKKKVFSLIFEIEQSMNCVNEMLDTNEVWKVSAYKSKNTSTDVGKLPSQIQFSLPEISSQEIISEKFCQMFSDLLPLSFSIYEEKYEESLSSYRIPARPSRRAGRTFHKPVYTQM